MSEFFNMIYDFLANSPVLYLTALPLTVFLYIVVRYLQGKTQWALLNPLLIPMLLIIALILITGSKPQDYQNGSILISKLLDPAVVCLAIPLYLKFKMIKAQAGPILICCTISIFISFIISYVSCHLLGVNPNMIPTIGARSITTPLAMDVANRLGGIASITACVVCCVGILGAVIGFPLMKLFHIRNKKAQGLAMGASAHAVGTSAANEHGETEGAYSSLGLIVCGILTTFFSYTIIYSF